MKRITFIFALLCAFVLSAEAQPATPVGKKREAMRKEMREFKMKFLAQEMELKGDARDEFFDVYGEMDEERGRLFCQTRALERRVRDDKNASDADYAAASKALAEAKAKDAEIEKKYDAKFATFLTQKQIFKMKCSEEKFRQKLREMHHKKGKKAKRPKAVPKR